MGVLSSPSLSDWVLPFEADGSGGAPSVAIVLMHSVLSGGVSGLAQWPRSVASFTWSLKAAQLTCVVCSDCCVRCSAEWNGCATC